jgi:N-acetylglutamate synthase-like GNAT family acetyltransferase
LSEFSLSPALFEHRPVIKALVRQAGLNPFGLDWRRFTVALDPAGQVIGCVQYKPHGREVMELASLVVVTPWQGQKVGRALVEHLQAQTGPPLWLMCRSTLIPYYHHFGFQEVTELTQLPPYFRRIARLAHLWHRVSGAEYVAIMVWRGP